MCLPVEGNEAMKSLDGSNENEKEHKIDPTKGGLADLYATKDEVVAEVMKAPKRRVDNVITHLYDSVCVLRMHTRICKDLRERYNKHYWDCKYQELGFSTAGFGLAAATWYVGNASTFAAATSAGAWSLEAVLGTIVGTSIVGVGGLTWYNGVKLRTHERNLMSTESMSASFQKCYRREIREGDEYVASIWQRIREPLQSSIEQTGGISQLPSSPSISYDREIERLTSVLDRDIPALRKVVSPATNPIWK